MAWTTQARQQYKQSREWFIQYHRDYYKKNRKKLLAQNKANRDKRYEIMRAAKDKPCADCGGRFHFSAMDFDHVRGKKKNCVARINVSTENLLAEIAKCEVVCSNCHRVRTYKRRYGQL